MDKDREMEREDKEVTPDNRNDSRLVKEPKELDDPKAFGADCTTHRKQ